MHFDYLETRDPVQREAALMAALSTQVAHAKRVSVAQAKALEHIHPEEIVSRRALAELPILRKKQLLDAQIAGREENPFGGFAACGWGEIRVFSRKTKRVFQSPGPLYEPEGTLHDPWRMARAMYAAGFREGELVHNSFSLHLTPAGAMMEAGAFSIGCAVFPGGVGNTALQLSAMEDLRPSAYTGTPGFLRILLETAEGEGKRVPGLKKALFSGEAYPPSLRAWMAARGVDGYQCYATADVGLIAYETASREGMVLDEDVIVEIVDPIDGKPVPDGEIGEVVVTTFNPDYPLLRFATGDLSAVLPGSCPTGRTQTRIRGWLGRADEATKVRGMFVRPEQFEQLTKIFPSLAKVQLVLEGRVGDERVTLCGESSSPSAELSQSIALHIRDTTKLRAEVSLVTLGSLDHSTKIIVDRREYD